MVLSPKRHIDERDESLSTALPGSDISSDTSFANENEYSIFYDDLDMNHPEVRVSMTQCVAIGQKDGPSEEVGCMCVTLYS